MVELVAPAPANDELERIRDDVNRWPAVALTGTTVRTPELIAIRELGGGVERQQIELCRHRVVPRHGQIVQGPGGP
jgi:hypothetical protein